MERISQGKETPEFWALWGLSSEPELKYRVNPDWDFWFADVETAEKTRPKDGRPLVYTIGRTKQMAAKEDEELQRMRELKPRLYTYPKGQEFSTVFDFEDLTENSLICLCDKGKHRLYVWKGIDFESAEEVVNKFVGEVKAHCWTAAEHPVEQIEQTQESQSDSFLEYFD